VLSLGCLLKGETLVVLAEADRLAVADQAERFERQLTAAPIGAAAG